MVIFADSLDGVEVLETGLFIDKLSGIGGLPKGTITEIFGDEGMGKSSLCYQIVRAAQRQGLKCLWADVEWSYDAKYAATLGVDNAKLGLVRHEFAEPVLDEILQELREGEWDLVVFDSVGGVHPRTEAEKDSDGKVVASQAGLMARFVRKIVPIIGVNKTIFIFINHSFVDIMSGRHLTSGGKKLAYHKSLSVRLSPTRSGTAIAKGDKIVGKKIVASVKKNKHAATEGTEMDVQFFFNVGFSSGADLVNEAIEKGVITKKGNTYYLGEQKIGIGINEVRMNVEKDDELRARVRTAYEGAA